jgi:LysM repeat protein
MNTPNPLVPQGSQLEQKSNARSRVKLAVFFVLTIHVVGLMALLVQGCRPDTQDTPDQPVPDIVVPTFDPVLVPEVETNDILLPPVQELPPDSEAWGAPVAPGVAPVAPGVVGDPGMPAPILQEYIVQKGDTYYSIGKKFGVTMQAITDANPGVDPKRLQVGKTIVVPPASSSAPKPVTSTASGEKVYTVVSGDTLSKIAKAHGTTWQAIRDLNNLPTTSIKVGQQLKIPATKPAAGGTGAGGF